MSPVARVAYAVWEFIVGDDWTLALGAVVAIAVTAGLAALGLAAWWVMAIAVPLLLALSVARAR